MVLAMVSPLDLDAPPGRRPLGCDLAAFGDRVALVTADGQISYADLAARVGRAAHRLGTGRRLVLVAGDNTVDALVAYLAALTAGHPVLLVPGEDTVIASMTSAYDPDVVVRPVRGRWTYEERRAGSAHDLHPELALLLSTSGSTGSPKLVRLSHDNLRANAESIATYLGITDADRAATTLPMHYCYGLSVVNSHLLRGAGLILTDLSVADTCFWELFRRARGTSLAGVPYTFSLLERAGFDAMRLPDLRYVTQAGGRLAPEKVRHYAELGRSRGWDLFVMYGQTEATARMAYLPPELAATRPGAVGVPVPGGQLRLDPFDDELDQPGDTGPDVGELVYTGPNVMLGYADGPADLAAGRTVHELRTGDLARRTPDGLFEIVGRRSRFVKVFGLRIDLQRIESELAADGVPASCAGGDDQLVVAVEATGERAGLGRLVARRCGVPVHAVRVVVVPELPRLPSGKVDHRAVAELGKASTRDTAVHPATDIRALYAEILDRGDVQPDSTFVGLGGDSLSYVEMSVRLEAVLGRLPAGWHTMPIRELCAAEPRPVRRPESRPERRTVRPPRVVDTGVLLRAVSIVLIVGTHIGVFTIRGGAHVLLAVAGFNFARFHLTDVDRRRRVRHLTASIARIAVPTMIFIALVVSLLGRYSWQNVFLLNEAIGPRVGSQRDLWFIETLVYLLVGLLVVLASPLADRCERRLPFALPLTLLAAGLLVRYDVLPLSPYDHLSTPARLFWFFAVGWAAAKARTRSQRLLVAATGAVAVVGYFGNPVREGVIITGLLLLVCVPHLPSTGFLNRLAGALAGSSLYIYLTHWQVYPLLADHSGPLALVVSIAAGVLFGAAVDRVAVRVTRWSRRRTPAHPRPARLGSANFWTTTLVPYRPARPGHEGDSRCTIPG
jgi:acyl-CoA synthetase (AMP-forming)/AMP-acid ligase II